MSIDPAATLSSGPLKIKPGEEALILLQPGTEIFAPIACAHIGSIRDLVIESIGVKTGDAFHNISDWNGRNLFALLGNLPIELRSTLLPLEKLCIVVRNSGNETRDFTFELYGWSSKVDGDTSTSAPNPTPGPPPQNAQTEAFIQGFIEAAKALGNSKLIEAVIGTLTRSVQALNSEIDFGRDQRHFQGGNLGPTEDSSEEDFIKYEERLKRYYKSHLQGDDENFLEYEDRLKRHYNAPANPDELSEKLVDLDTPTIPTPSPIPEK